MRTRGGQRGLEKAWNWGFGSGCGEGGAHRLHLHAGCQGTHGRGQHAVARLFLGLRSPPFFQARVLTALIWPVQEAYLQRATFIRYEQQRVRRIDHSDQAPHRGSSSGRGGGRRLLHHKGVLRGLPRRSLGRVGRLGSVLASAALHDFAKPEEAEEVVHAERCRGPAPLSSLNNRSSEPLLRPRVFPGRVSWQILFKKYFQRNLLHDACVFLKKVTSV